MPTPELYKDKVEVSLDGRQIFYLFFGGAAIVGLVFVLGVMVGRRVEARGHLDRAETQTASDPLAALDRLERSDNLSFHGALTGSEAPTDVEKAIAAKAGKPAPAPADKAEAKAEVKAAQLDKPDARAEAKDGKDKSEKADAKHDDEKKAKKHDDKAEHADKSDKPKESKESKDAKELKDAKDGKESRESRDTKDGKAARESRDAKDAKDAKESSRDGKDKESKDRQASTDEKSDKAKYTLQLSSFQDKAEAEAFLSSLKSAGYQPYLTQAEVSGKGTFYRVRLGSYRSVDAANDARAELDKTAHKSASVMKL